MIDSRYLYTITIEYLFNWLFFQLLSNKISQYFFLHDQCEDVYEKNKKLDGMTKKKSFDFFERTEQWDDRPKSLSLEFEEVQWIVLVCAYICIFPNVFP